MALLSGNWRPVVEEVDAPELTLEGELPADLEGAYVRTGPNPVGALREGHHLFDGDGMLHMVEFACGRASYRSRFVRTAAYLAARSGKGRPRGGLCSPPSPRPWPEHSPYANTANAAFVVHHGRALALCEFGSPHEVRLPTLETVGRYPAGGRHAPFSAHAKHDPKTGELWYLRYFVEGTSAIEVGRLDCAGRAHDLTVFETPVPVMVHDFAISESYVCMFELPPFFSSARAALGHSGWTSRPLAPPRLLLVSRRDGAVKSLPIARCAVTHLANAFERDGRLHVIGVRFSAVPAFLRFDAEELDDMPAGSSRGQLHEWVVDLATDQVSERVLCEREVEFPRVNDALTGQATRFIYALLEGPDGGFLKLDAESGKRQAFRVGAGRYAGEPVFVPRPHKRGEDDGWLLGFVWDARPNRSSLVVLDALSPESGPVTCVHLPTRVPFGFHGSWVPRSDFPGGAS